MEIWHLPYLAVLDIPWSRRYRLFRKKEDLEKKRESERRASVARAKAKR